MVRQQEFIEVNSVNCGKLCCHGSYIDLGYPPFTLHSLSHQNQQSSTLTSNKLYIQFTLISTKEISQLIYNCLNFLARNLPEATVNLDNL